MLRLNVGTNRKIGQPDYGSAGASCNLELELDTTLFQDLDGLQQVVRRAYAACTQAVNDELARLTHHSQHQHPHDVSQPVISPEPVVEIRTSPVIQGARVTASIPTRTITPARTTTTTETHPSPRPATTSQVRAIRAICSRRKIELVGLLREKFGIQTADELGIRQASDLIDELKSDEGTGGQPTSHVNGNGNGTLCREWRCPMIAGAGAIESLLPVITPASTSPANPANDIAKNLTGRDYISWSAISTFRTCPLKYKFRYVDGLPEESVSSALVFGTGIHTAVEQHFQALLTGDEQPDVERLMFAYRGAWLPHDPAAISFGTKETCESLDDLASRMLTAFLASDQARVSGRVLGVEEEIRGMLVEGVPDLFGSVDLLTEDADSLVITDIKTSRGNWSPEQVEDLGEQLLLYAKLASEISPGKKITTRFLVLTKTKEPVIEEHVREVNPAAVKRTLVGVEWVWRAIESGAFYPAPSVVACSGCGYREACRAWMG